MIFICYNYLPLIATYVYDLNINGYLKAGVKPLHNYPILNNILLLKDGDKIFVKTNYLQYFFNTIFPKIQTKFYLITGVSDYEIDNTYLNYLNDNKIIKWIGVNISIQSHNKVCKMLIGFQEIERNGGNQDLLYKMYTIKKIFNEKIDKLLITYFNNTHSIRNNINKLFNNRSYIEFGEKLDFENYLKKINNYKFVLCPRGNGLDTHRFCEILLMGSVPIVEKNGLSDLYKKFPCIIVDTFNDINHELLKNFIFDIEKYKIFESYLFVDKINANI